METTLFEKIWNTHLVSEGSVDCPATLYIDFHLLNEVTSPQAFAQLDERGLGVRRPEKTLATIDHATPTIAPSPSGKRPYISIAASNQVTQMEMNARKHGIPFLGWDDPRRGIVHVVGPELGLTLPGMTIVCGDSHTSTHGAFGSLAFGIGTSEVAHVLATQSLLQQKPRTMRVTINGQLQDGVTAKDLALAVIARLGADGGTGFVIEYAGSAVRELTMEGRMTLCNMTIECGARTGLVAPDDVTFDWLRGRPEVPSDFDNRLPIWRSLATDSNATFDQEIELNATLIAPMVTWGITPDTAIPIDSTIPPAAGNGAAEMALHYMQLEENRPILGTPVNFVFIGSCTNARLPDLRAAAAILKGKKIASHVTLLVVPGSETVRMQAEAEGLDKVFIEAGGQWRLSGCSMCLGMNGDHVPAGQLAVSTSNRNFVGRQGPGARTVLASPITAAASALAGAITDPRSVI